MVVSAGLVWAVALLIYLADCVTLVERGQAIFERARSGWLASFGARGYVLTGKPVLLLNPIAPWRPCFRSLALFALPKATQPTPARLARAIAPFGLLTGLQALLVLAALPWLMHHYPGWPFVIALAASYLNAITILGGLWFVRPQLGVAKSALAIHGLYCLVCLPLSINGARKVGLMAPSGGDARRYMGLLRGNARAMAREALAIQAEEARQECEDLTERASLLDDLCKSLRAQEEDS